MLFFFCGYLPAALAQQPQAASSTSRRIITPADTMPFTYTFALSPERSYPSDDTLPNEDFRQYNPARRQLIDWGTLGNLGSSARPLLFETFARRGFDMGIHAFDLYHVQPEDLRFYRNTRSLTNVFFSQGRTQFDGMLNARFARTFAGGTNFSLDYRTINNIGQYRYQRDKHNALALGLWIPVSRRYELFLIYARNVNRQEENGGIVTDTIFGSDAFSGPITAPIRLPDGRAYTRTDDQRYQLTQHLKFAGAVGKRELRATHSMTWALQNFKFADAGLEDDRSFFDTFLVDQRGLRNFIDLKRLDNTFEISTFKAKKEGRPSDILSAGLAHSFFDLHEETRDTTFSNLFLTGKLAITPSERFAFVATANLGLLGDNFGEYQLNGDLSLGLGKAGQLRAGLRSQLYPPALLFQSLYVSKRPVWQNAFVKPVENSLSATYSLPLIGLEITARTHLLNNYLYYDQKGVASQTTSPVQVAQLILRENIRVGPIHLDNTIALQQNNRSDVLRLPDWFTKNSLYFSGKVFKKRMSLDAGFDFRLNSEFRPDGYQPLTAQFYLQDSLTQKPFPWLDAFISFKVQSFRLFFRYENLGTILWDKTAVNYQTAYYPQPFGTFRLGIGWRFMDRNTSEGENTNVTPPGGSSAPPSGSRF